LRAKKSTNMPPSGARTTWKLSSNPAPNPPSETHVAFAEGGFTHKSPSPLDLRRGHLGTVPEGSSPVPKSITARS